MPYHEDRTLMPDGTPFDFWDDATTYTRAWHVANAHPQAHDTNEGSLEAPLKTLAAAAQLVGPGEKVVIHGGTYRECLQPQRGGMGPDQMIAFEAAPGEEVIISAADLWEPDAQRPEGKWYHHVPVWHAPLPVDDCGSFNPFVVNNISRSEWFPWQERPLQEILRAQLRCGALYQDGRRLQQVHEMHDVVNTMGSFCVNGEGTEVVFRLFDDADPKEVSLEVSKRKQCVVPSQRGLGFIALRGLTCLKAANPLPFPHYGAVSSRQGFPWIIEDMHIAEANAVGLDLGRQSERIAFPKWQPEEVDGFTSGRHIVRRNTITNCGLAGMSGASNMNGILVEDNEFSNLGWLGLEHVYEAAAIKMHAVHEALIRRNRIYGLRDCCGIWLDHSCGNNRVTDNRIFDLVTVLGGIYIEISLGAHLIDHNVVWKVSDTDSNDPPKDDTPGGLGIVGDMTENTWVHRNIVCETENYGISFHLAQKGRLMRSRTPMSRGHEAHDNLILNCGSRLYAARPEHITCNGNIHGQVRRWPKVSGIGFPEPERIAITDLEGWQTWFGHDTDGWEGALPLSIEEREGVLTLVPAGDLQDLPTIPLIGKDQTQLLKDGKAMAL